MDNRAGRFAAGIALGALAYLAILPMLWPEPAIEVTVPAEARMGETIPVAVSLSAWHSNIDIVNVRFYVDYTATTAVGPKGTFYPEMIVERQARRFMGPFGRNPITLPHTVRADGEVALGKYIDQGLIGPGDLVGKIDVTYNYTSGRGGRRTAGSDRTRTATQSVPFRIAIRE